MSKIRRPFIRQVAAGFVTLLGVTLLFVWCAAGSGTWGLGLTGVEANRRWPLGVFSFGDAPSPVWPRDSQIEHLELTGEIALPRTGNYRFRWNSPSAATVEIDAVENATVPDSPQIYLTQGIHHIQVLIAGRSLPAESTLDWDADSRYRFTAVPPAALSPSRLAPLMWRLRRLSTPLLAAVASVWSVLLLLAALALFRQDLRTVWRSRSGTVAIAGCALLFLIGVTWGWPGSVWAPDELVPSDIAEALGHYFVHGWADKYPPLHYYFLSLLYLPMLLSEHWRHASLFTPTSDIVFLQGRLLSVLLATGTVAAFAMLAEREFGRGYAWPTALLVATAIPFQ